MKNKREHAEIQRRKYHERIKDGRCHKCGNERGEKRADRTTCQECGEKENARLTAYYRRRAEQ